MAVKVNIDNPGPVLTREDIDAFEREIGGRLSEDYRQFLLDHNGGLVEPLLGLTWEGEVETVGGFDQLLPTHDSGLRRGLHNLRELNTDGFLPVTGTWNGQDACLTFREHIGAVFFTLYTYENEVAVDVTMAPLAGSFTQFLDLLVEIPDPYCRIVDLGRKGTPDDLAAYLAEGNSIDALGKHKATILGEAIKVNNLPMIHACIERGASLSRTIRLAVGNNRLDLIEFLFNAGADVNERNEFGRTPIFYVGGTEVPGEDGARNRAMRDLLIKLGAVE